MKSRKSRLLEFPPFIVLFSLCTVNILYMRRETGDMRRETEDSTGRHETGDVRHET